jgi:hypothetical protein
MTRAIRGWRVTSDGPPGGTGMPPGAAGTAAVGPAGITPGTLAGRRLVSGLWRTAEGRTAARRTPR